MVLTKKTTVVYDSEAHKIGSPRFNQMRGEVIDLMTKLGKTDGKVQDINPVTEQRSWLDEHAAEQWKSWLDTIGSMAPIGVVSVTIEDI